MKLKKWNSFFSSLKPKLIITFAFILIVPSLFIGISAFFTAKDAVEEKMKEDISNNIEFINTTIENLIEPNIETVSSFSEQITQETLTEEKRDNLNQLIRYFADSFTEEVRLIYVGTSSGDLISYPEIDLGSDFDSTTREWYLEAMENEGEIVITKPYISADDGEMVVSIAKTNSDGSGVVGVDITLANIQGLVEQVQIGEEGFGMLLDRNQTFIYHPVYKAGTTIKDDYFKHLYESDSGEFSYVANGEVRVMRFITNERTGWKIAGNLLNSEITAAVGPIFQETVIIIGISLVVGAVLVYFIIRSIIKPIRVLNKSALAISEGDLSNPIEVKTNDEIGQLAKAMNTMQETL